MRTLSGAQITEPDSESTAGAGGTGVTRGLNLDLEREHQILDFDP
jgi:hypothetical protein